jgi:thiol-disulfide isomerase/thioredoxin
VAVVLWGKPECSLCDKAQAILDRLADEYPLRIEKRDITRDPAAFERYRYVIPVVEFVDGPRFEGKITEFRLRRALEEWRGR